VALASFGLANADLGIYLSSFWKKKFIFEPQKYLGIRKELFQFSSRND
jgi:hypothetical protein